nr:hypothetical protein [Streptomyces pathocidini]
MSARETATAGDDQPELGSLVIDTGDRNRVGVVMGHVGPYVQLRPVGGGREWDAAPERVRPLTSREELSARLAARNKGARWGR